MKLMLSVIIVIASIIFFCKQSMADDFTTYLDKLTDEQKKALETFGKAATKKISHGVMTETDVKVFSSELRYIHEVVMASANALNINTIKGNESLIYAIKQFEEKPYALGASIILLSKIPLMEMLITTVLEDKQLAVRFEVLSKKIHEHSFALAMVSDYQTVLFINKCEPLLHKKNDRPKESKN